MNIKQLEYFLAVSELLNFTNAAKKFFISQSAMTLQIRSLEEELGVQLFERNNRKVTLTPAGRTFTDDARAIVKRSQDALNRARQATTLFTGHLNLGFVKGYEKTILSDLLFDFHINYPNISMSLTRENVAELYDGILSGELDLIFNILYSFEEIEDLADMEYLLLREYPLLAVMPASHPLSHRVSINRQELKDYPFVDIKKNEEKYGEAQTIRNTFLNAGFSPNIQYISDDIETSLLAVAAGLGYALLPSYITDSLMQKEKVIAIPLENEEHQLPVIAAWHKENANPATQKFIQNFLMPAVKQNRF